ncbi:spe-45 [Pristionchus pacificus]|uniref:Oig-7 n=1 Tax=Pristionchus pacificus TaxID=54126 RepID=A0A2A6BSE3_PRIPA|nr:spe-45 [Pristionchus pacificus]|eukprot:PDM68859.1 oig-7 [Pristionchus pacificus]
MSSLRVVVALLLLFALLAQCAIENNSNRTRKTTTTPRPKTKRVKDKIASTKRTLMSFVGKKRMVFRSTARDAPLDRIIYGTMLQLRCHHASEVEQVEWAQDGVPIRPTFANWRMDVTDKGVLEIWPLVYNDSGRWECSVGGAYSGALEVEVLSITDAYKIGVIGYFTTSLFFLPVLAIGIACLSARHLDPPPPAYDPIADLLTKQVDGAQFRERLEDEHGDAVMRAGKVKEAKSPRVAQRTIRAMLNGGP